MGKSAVILTLIKKNLTPILGVFIYVLAGILLIFIALYIFEHVVQCNIKEEFEDRNFSVGLSVAALILGVSIMVSAAIKGRAPRISKHSDGHGCGAPIPLFQPEAVRNSPLGTPPKER